MKILVIGASGMLGKPVTKAMITAGFDATLLARDVEKLKGLFPGTTIQKGDVLDKDSLIKAMQGVDAVYCNLSVLPAAKDKDRHTEREGMDNIIAAGKQTGIRRIAYLSSLVHRYQGMNNFNWWAFGIKQQAVKKIQGSGIAYTIFYPSTFMETYPFQMMRGNKIAMLGDSIMPMWFIAADDYGKQVAASFHRLTNENRDYAVQGTEAFTFADANKIFIGNYRKAKLSTMKAPIGLMKFLGHFHQPFNYAWHICEALNKYPEKFESETSWEELGKPVITLKDYAASL